MLQPITVEGHHGRFRAWEKCW